MGDQEALIVPRARIGDLPVFEGKEGEDGHLWLSASWNGP